MKQLCLLLFFCSATLVAQKQNLERSTLIIPPKQVVQLDYPYYKGFVVKLWNKAKFDVGVSARAHATDSLQKGFGLSKGANATLAVPAASYLQLENRFLAPLKVEYIVYKGKPGKNKTGAATPQRGFYLINSTAQSIPLKIPGIMNPNLSPFSKSGVDLPLGQKILLKVAGKDLLLLTVTDTIPKGARINVADLIDRALNPEE
ncbi:MAG: hypothetical protein ACPG7X_08875 [Flavobacteriaceae bacterium]